MRCAIAKRASSRRPFSIIDELERRQFFAITASFADGVLNVVGDRDANQIVVGQTPDGKLTVNEGTVAVAGGTPTASTTTKIVVVGGDGNDEVHIDGSVRFIPTGIDGGGGNDVIFGGLGSDEVHGGAGLDILIGNTGDDRLLGGDGDDMIFGDLGNDWIVGGTGRDRAIGGAGNDVLLGGAGDDFLDGGEGDDTLSGGRGRDILIGGAGNNVLEDDEREVVAFGAGSVINYVGLE